MPCVWTDLEITVNGESLLLDASGAAFAKADATLIFADLHFEKGSSYARGRQFLPPYDTADTLRRMAAAIERHRPARVIALGDSFHDPDAGARVGRDDRALLESLGRHARFTWITGNHDPHPPAWLVGEVVESLRLGGLLLRHEPLSASSPAKWRAICIRVPARRNGAQCAAVACSDGLRPILPSFGAPIPAGWTWAIGHRLAVRRFSCLYAGTRRVYVTARRGSFAS
jgi:DNA ligase-associated metallophosphoesterase